MRKYMLFYTLLIICILFTGCSRKAEDNISSITDETGEEIEEKELEKKESDQKENTRKYTVWTTYWQTDNILEEFDYREDSIESICYFAAYFNEERKLFIPKETDETYSLLKKTYDNKKYGSYLTFVNDLLKPDGTSSLKDTELLYELFSTEASIDAHIGEILTLAEVGGYQGIEIDYEAIRNDRTLWNLFINFVEKLNQETFKKNIPLRIVLEPSFQAEELKLPEGPEYVVMCYNLYGYGTEPGPKADKIFLQELIHKMKELPGKVNFALATGGFDFGKNGEIAQITQIEAEELFMSYDVTPIRDEGSGSLVFTYEDEAGVSHEVWYADQDTIEFWSDIISREGEYSLSLWRIGGNQVNE